MPLQTDVVDTVLSEPLLVIALGVVIYTLVRYQRGLSYTEFIIAHRAKCIVFRILDGPASKRGRPLVADKSDASEEFVRHTDATPRTVARRLRSARFDPHLVATAKRRDGQCAHSQWVQFHDGEKQTEVYLFPSNGGTDVYAHFETSVRDPEGHLTDEQTPGDPLGAVANALDA